MLASATMVLGIDIGGTKTALGFVDREGHFLAETVIPTEGHLPAGRLFQRIHQEAEALRATLEGPRILAGIGIGAPNANYYTCTIEQPPNLQWDTVDLRAELAPYYQVPVVATNDANAVAIGEMLFGAGRGLRDFIAITLGTGLGSGIVTNGELVYGADGNAGELGHMTVDPQGRQCGCGNVGCLETYASASGIRRTVAQLMADRRTPSSLRQVGFDQMDSRLIYEEARKGDPLALEAFEVTGRILGAKLAESVLHTRPQAFIFFGGLAKAGDLILEPTRRSLDQHLMPIFRGKVEIIPSGIQGGNAAVLGAAALIWNELQKDRIQAPGSGSGTAL